MIDLRQTDEWSSWLSSTGWQIDEVKSSLSQKKIKVFIKKLPLFPISFMKIQRFVDRIDKVYLDRIKKKYKVFWSVMEPAKDELVDSVKQLGYHLNKEPYLPTKTRVIDLTKNDEDLISDMSENFRRIIKKEKSLENKVDSKLISSGEFYEGWRRWSKSYILPRNQFDSLVKAFEKKIEFWAMIDGIDILSAIMCLYTPDSCFYYQTWTSQRGRKGSEHVILTWETIKRAKKLGKKFYNFEGIQDKRFPISRWDGFTEFKRRFGGYEISYPGSFLKWL